MKRRLLDLIALVSLLLCVAFAALWVQSWRSPKSVKDQWQVAEKPGRITAYTAYSQWGRIQISWGEGQYLPAVLTGYFRHADWKPDLSHPWRWLGVYVERERPGAPARFRYFSVPHGLLVALTIVLPAWRAARLIDDRRRRTRLAAGLCRRCGYDLRASPERCPECGDAVGVTA